MRGRLVNVGVVPVSSFVALAVADCADPVGAATTLLVAAAALSVAVAWPVDVAVCFALLVAAGSLEGALGESPKAK